MGKVVASVQNNIDKIRAGLSHIPLDWKPKLWLDTKIPLLNQALGHKDYGIPYGRVIELFAWESQGKTSIALSVEALAQRDGALVIHGDVENSWDPGYARRRGFAPCINCAGTGVIPEDSKEKFNLRLDEKGKEWRDCANCGGMEADTGGLDKTNLLVIRPYVGNFCYHDKHGKEHMEKEPRLATAQELCTEMESGMKLEGWTKKILVLDSIAALATEGEMVTGLVDANMRTNMDLPMFMGRLLRRWVGTAQVYNTCIILINQMRSGPAKFGDPNYTPGGNAPKFYSHVRAKVQRVAGGKITSKKPGPTLGKTIGFSGVMKCIKNKSGGDEGLEIGYRLYREGGLEFVEAKEVKADK